MTDVTRFVYDAATAVDPLGDLEKEAEKAAKHNRAKVGSGRPSSLLYTYGPGSIMDLPQFTIMSTGLDDWDRIWRRRDSLPPQIHAPRLREVVRMLLRSPDVQLRPHPWQPKRISLSTEGNDLGVPARVFPQWLRCTGCDMLGMLSQFDYRNTHPFRTDLACFEHAKCTGRSGNRTRKPARRTAVPARYLLACVDGHLDEFPYDQWVHRGKPCAQAQFPALKMVDRTAGKGASAVIHCASCDMRRPMNEAQGEAGKSKLPDCRGRHPHLDAFEPKGCRNKTRLILVGASNLWFPATQSIIVMPESQQERASDLADRIRTSLGDKLAKYRENLDILRDLLEGKVDITLLSDQELAQAVTAASAPPATEEEQEEQIRAWDPVDLLVPEWRYLLKDPLGTRHEDEPSGLTLSKRERDPALRPEITRVLAVERLRKVNALVGFTRIDDMDRVGDLPRRLAPLTRAARPTWTVATEDRGEGIFLQLGEERVAAWEDRVLATDLWQAHREAHQRNFNRRFSDTAASVDPDTRLRFPRYWLVHTFAHVLIRELAMTCGYSAASLSERLYAWPEAEGREPAAGLLICTTASDSDGTLGGLVQLSEPARLQRVVSNALDKATRCSSDPICAMRTPQDPEDFLHGAACHCCVMASETSCERANRFLDRRFLVDLPGSDLGFFSPLG
ncbi:DrmB family protein [Streptomyces rubiginosohelvolus]|uniref:DrmB family protein n=1 Tax=Streptomyces rubiginosohelvolus TaxID=67362 RepID=UPI003812CC0E